MGFLIVFVAVLLVYLQSLGGALVWDDRFLILGAPLVERGASLESYLRAPFWTGAGASQHVGYYRPLVTLSFALDHRLHGANAAGFHLTNVAVHAANAMLLLALLKKHGVRPFVAVMLAIGWAFLPRLTEAGAWVSGRTDLLASGFALAALLSFGPTLKRSLLAASFLGLGLLAKESAVAVVPAIVFGEWIGGRREGVALTRRRALEVVLPLLLVLLVYAVLRFRAIGWDVGATSLGPVRRAMTVLDALGTYAAMLLDAFRPRAVIGRIGVVNPAGVAAGVAVIVGMSVLLVRSGKRLGRTEAVGLGLAFGALLPVLHLVPLPARMVAADRYLYLPAAGFVLAAGPAIDRALGVRRPAFAAAFALVIALGVASGRRVGVWSNELEFWVQTYLQTPRTNNVAAIELGSVFYRASLFDEASQIYRRALSSDDPERRTPAFNLALCLTRLGHRQEARRLLEASTKRQDKHANANVYFHLATIELRDGHVATARARLERAALDGNEGARWLLPRLDDIEATQKELALSADDELLDRRARLLTVLGEDATANALWARAQAEPDAPESVSLEALLHLARSGGRAPLVLAYRRHTRRFGAISPDLEESIAVRIAELDQLMAARSRLGLTVSTSDPALAH